MNSLNKYIFVYLGDNKQINIKKQNIKNVYIDLQYSIMQLGLKIGQTATFVLLHDGNSITLENPTFSLYDGQRYFSYQVDWNYNSDTEEKFNYDEVIRHTYTDADNPTVNLKALSPIRQINLSGHTDISSLYLPSSIRTLSASCFAECTNLERVDITSGPTNIQSLAFKDCSSLKQMNIPTTVTSLANDAFKNCVGTVVTIDYETYIALKESVDSDAHLGLVLNVTTNTATEIANAAFQGCKILYNINLNNVITKILAHAFEDCENLSAVHLPDNLTTLNNAAFANCVRLTDIEIPAGVSTIKPQTFQNCAKLSGVVIDGTITTIGESAFEGCTNGGNGLKSFNFSNVQTIGKNAFKSTDLTSTTFQNSLTSICEGAFSSDSNLATVELPSSGLQYIGNDAFSKVGLESPQKITVVTFPSTVKAIGERAFKENALASVTLGDSVVSVGSSAFESNAIKSVSLPNLTTSKQIDFGARCFANNTTLTSITSENTTDLVIQDIPASMFENCTSLTSFPTTAKINAVIKNIGDGAFKGCTSLKQLSTYVYGKSGKLNIESIGDSAFEGCTSFVSLGACLTSNASTALTSIGSKAFAQCTSMVDTSKVMSLYLPTYVKVIKPYAFANCLKATFPAKFWSGNANNLTAIEEGAFLSCAALKRMTTSINLASLGISSFANCTALARTTFDSLANLAVISDSAFENCYKVKTTVFPASLLSIGDAAFHNTITTAADFSKATSLTHIGENAFKADLTSYAKIASITGLNSTKLQKIGDYAFANQTTLTSISQMPNTLLSLDMQKAFDGCTKLTAFTYANLFNGCTSLISVNMPTYIKAFGNSALTATATTNGYAFKGCNNLTSVTFPSGCTLTAFSYATEGFAECHNLKQLDFTNCPSLTAIYGGSLFKNCHNLTSITFNSTSQAFKGDAMFQGCSSLVEIKGLTNVTALNGANMFLSCVNIEEFAPTYSESTAIANFYKTDFFSYCSKLKKVKLHTKTTTIYDRMFHATSLETLGYGTTLIDGKCNLPTTVTAINLSAFSNSGIKDISQFGDLTSLKTIGNYAFSNCHSLTAVTIPKNAYSSFGQYVFLDCPNLTAITFDMTKAVVTGTTTGKLKNYAYLGCNNGTIIHCTDGDLIYPNKS